MKIITVTLNPAFDIHCYAESFQPFHENLASITECEAGGKGVNISRALGENGVESTALVVIGKENGEAFVSALKADKINAVTIDIDGRIRENITLHTDGAPETRISFCGYAADDTLIERVRHELDSFSLNDDTILTFTGRLPEGVSLDAAKKLLKELKSYGVRIVIDSRSFAKDDLVEVSPWLIKPNEEEILLYSNATDVSFESAMKAAQALRESGIENVMVSLGEKGALLVCADGCYVAHAPSVNALSTIGAGDSSIGGFCAAASLGKSYADMLRYAVCYGSAACMTEGTRPPKRQDVNDLLEKVDVEKM